MAMDDATLDRGLKAHTEDAVTFLCDLIRIPSLRGKEGPVSRLIHDRLRGFCSRAELMHIPASFTEDPEYRWPLPGLL